MPKGKRGHPFLDSKPLVPITIKVTVAQKAKLKQTDNMSAIIRAMIDKFLHVN